MRIIRSDLINLARSLLLNTFDSEKQFVKERKPKLTGRNFDYKTALVK